MNTFGYVKGIDGMRAIAVLAVILFHLNSNFLPVGFVGVDIFFVISGFVISQSLYSNDCSTLKQYILLFYKRRILRIFPVLLFCILVTSFFSIFFIPQGFWLSDSNLLTALSAIFGVSNIYLVKFADGYFSSRIPFNPFVHTWSLAVEEQFYFIFPILFFFWKKNQQGYGYYFKNIPKYSLFLLVGISLVLSAYETESSPDRAYYLLISRFWELGLGGLTFQILNNHKSLNKTIGDLALFFGFILVIVGSLFADKIRFPYPWAMAPAFGSSLMISGLIFGSTNNLLQIILKSHILSFIGKISYSLYLWHWPVVVLFNWTVGLEDIRYVLMAICITFSFSFFSYFILKSISERIRT